jgi:excisionase family DNA binding protein
MSQIIITSKEELESFILNSVKKAFVDSASNEPHVINSEILSLKEASLFLNLASQTIYGFTSKREIPFIKKGKKLYFQKSVLEKWLLEGKCKSKAEILNDNKY